MNPENLKAAVALVWLAGMFSGVALLAWLVHVNADVGAVAAVATLVGSLITHGSRIVHNLFPAPAGEGKEKQAS